MVSSVHTILTLVWGAVSRLSRFTFPPSPRQCVSKSGAHSGSEHPAPGQFLKLGRNVMPAGFDQQIARSGLREAGWLENLRVKIALQQDLPVDPSLKSIPSNYIRTYLGVLIVEGCLNLICWRKSCQSPL